MGLRQTDSDIHVPVRTHAKDTYVPRSDLRKVYTLRSPQVFTHTELDDMTQLQRGTCSKFQVSAATPGFCLIM